MKTSYYTATSINGFIADSSNALDWLFQFGEVEGMQDHYPKFLTRIGAIAMGPVLCFMRLILTIPIRYRAAQIMFSDYHCR